MITDDVTCSAYDTVFGNAVPKTTWSHAVLNQDNFANDKTYSLRDSWQLTAKNDKVKLNGNLWLIFAIDAKVDAMI